MINGITELKYWDSFQFIEYGTAIAPTWTDVFTTPVEVTSGRACYDLSTAALKINSDQTIASFISKVHPSPIEVKLGSNDDEDEENGVAASVTTSKNLFTGVSSNSVVVGESDLTISLMRTVRVPENSRVYNLPPNLGRFPVFDVRSFSSRLPTSVVAQGGLFFPMYRKSRVRFEADVPL
jgi:hypothetical protein